MTALLLEDAPAGGGVAPALWLAVLQGLAEFLPISSSGHLVIARDALGMREAGLALDVALHAGTLLAVVWAYRADLFGIARDVARGSWRMALWLALATVPAGVAGLALEPLLARAAQSTTAAGAGLLVTAVFLSIGDRARRAQGPAADEDPASYGVPPWGLALLLGTAQALALCPGVSRSGTTIAAGLVLGLPIAQAARLSFLMSVPAVAGAAAVELPGALERGIGGLSGSALLAAVALAALVGWAALRILLVVMARGALRWFAAYCALLGLLALALL